MEDYNYTTQYVEGLKKLVNEKEAELKDNENALQREKQERRSAESEAFQYKTAFKKLVSELQNK